MDRVTAPQLMQMLNDDYNTLLRKNDQLVELAKSRAEAEQRYHIEFAKKLLELKNKGNAVTVLKDLTRGSPNITVLKYNLDVADALLTACRESIKDIREHIGVLRSLLTWQRAELQAGHVAPF